MQVEPLIIEDGTWWTVRLGQNQDPIGQLEFVVKPRADKTWAKDLTELDAQEHFIFRLISRTAKRAIEQIYHPKSVRWIFDTDESGYCRAWLIPEYFICPYLPKLSATEMVEDISQMMELVRTGHV